jgi:hypothetical protein
MKKILGLVLVCFVFSQASSLAVDRSQLGSDIDGEAAIDSSGWSVSLSSAGDLVAIGAPYSGNNWNAGQVRIYEYSGGTWTNLDSDIYGTNGVNLGYSVSLSSTGDRVAAGAPAKSKGHVSIYEYTGGVWTNLGSDIKGEAAWDWSGVSVSLSSAGDRVAIGALGNDDAGDEAGHVRIYEYVGTNWVQLGSDIDGEAEGDKSGSSVSLSAAGDRVAIGARNNGDSGFEAGHVRIYEYSGPNWIQLGSDIDGEAAEDHFGFSVSLSAAGDRVAAGATANDYAGTDAGHVRIYEYVGTNWIQLGSDIDGANHWDWAGYSVSLSSAGDRVAVGAPGPDVEPVDINSNLFSAGQARIYEYSGGDWIQLGSNIVGEAGQDGSGGSVFLSSTGDRVAIGAPRNGESGDRAGHVRVYGDLVVDTDGDGLCDALEAYYSTDLEEADTDADGETDYAEVAMGFDPTNQFSKLDLTGWSTNDYFEISFMTATDRLFYVESKDSLMQSNWIERINVSGTGNPTNWMEPAMDSNQFYRIKTQIQ